MTWPWRRVGGPGADASSVASTQLSPHLHAPCPRQPLHPARVRWEFGSSGSSDVHSKAKLIPPTRVLVVWRLARDQGRGALCARQLGLGRIQVNRKPAGWPFESGQPLRLGPWPAAVCGGLLEVCRHHHLGTAVTTLSASSAASGLADA